MEKSPLHASFPSTAVAMEALLLPSRVSHWDMGHQAWGQLGIEVPSRVIMGEQNLRLNRVRKPVDQ